MPSFVPAASPPPGNSAVTMLLVLSVAYGLPPAATADALSKSTVSASVPAASPPHSSGTNAFTGPLACIDARSVTADELVDFTIEHRGQGTQGGIYFASWRPAHRWWFWPSMSPDEVLLVKQWDSHGGLANGRADAGEGMHATFCLHSAFADPTSSPGVRDRESIEVRLVVVY